MFLIININLKAQSPFEVTDDGIVINIKDKYLETEDSNGVIEENKNKTTIIMILKHIHEEKLIFLVNKVFFSTFLLNKVQKNMFD